MMWGSTIGHGVGWIDPCPKIGHHIWDYSEACHPTPLLGQTFQTTYSATKNGARCFNKHFFRQNELHSCIGPFIM
jgi:hypothetical protein